MLACSLLVVCTAATPAGAAAVTAPEVVSSAATAVPAAPSDVTAIWEPPLGYPLQVSRVFSLVNGPYGAGHRGVDLSAHVGQAVRAPTSGTVSFVGFVVDRPVLSIRVNEHTVVSFEPITSELSVGEAVERSQSIGEVAHGHCTPTCLHLGVRINDEYVNPLRFLRLRPELLPWS